MTTVLENKKEEKTDSIREIYSFTVEQTEKVKVTELEERENEGGTKEKVEITKEIDQAVPYRVILKQPNRREM